MTEFSDIWYRSHDDLRLYARDYVCRGETGNGEARATVLCIPGLTRNSADFHDICRHLQSRCKVRAIAVDLRGRGRSDYDSHPENYHPGTYVRDLQALIDDQRLDNVILLGTSLGGLLSLLLGSTRPHWLKGLIINDFAPELEQAGLDRIKSYVGKSRPVHTWEEAVAQSREINGNELPDLNDQQWLAFCKNIYREDDAGRPVLAYDPAIAQPFNGDKGKVDPAPLWAAFDNLPDVPLLMIRGGLSDLVPRSCVETMQQRRPELVCVEVPNRGHAPLLNEPEAVEAISELLQSL